MGSVVEKTIDENPLNKPGNIFKNIEQDDGIEFQRQQISKIIRNGQLKEQKYEITSSGEYSAYARSLNMALKESTKGTREILSILDSMAQGSDRPVLHDVKQKYTETKYVAIKCFLFLFVSKYYPKIHGKMAKSSYQNLIQVIVRVRQQLYEYNQKTNSCWKINLDSPQKFRWLYRGIEYPDKNMLMGRKVLWRSFVSTSRRKKIYEKFGHGRYMIQLNPKGYHPHIVVPKEFSEFADEEEVILFPYFYFEVKHVNKYESGELYLIYQQQKP